MSNDVKHATSLRLLSLPLHNLSLVEGGGGGKERERRERKRENTAVRQKEIPCISNANDSSRRPWIDYRAISGSRLSVQRDSLFIFFLIFSFSSTYTRKYSRREFLEIPVHTDPIRSDPIGYGYDRSSTSVIANYAVRCSVNLICQRGTRWYVFDTAADSWPGLSQIVVVDGRAPVRCRRRQGS